MSIIVQDRIVGTGPNAGQSFAGPFVCVPIGKDTQISAEFTEKLRRFFQENNADLNLPSHGVLVSAQMIALPEVKASSTEDAEPLPENKASAPSGKSSRKQKSKSV